MEDLEFSDGYICSTCAFLAGATDIPWPCTCHEALCPCCEKKTTMLCLSDFIWPNESIRYVWD